MFRLPTVQFTQEQETFRLEVRKFLQEHVKKGTFTPKCDSWLSGVDPSFSKLIGEQGWIGMTWPKKYGGQERSTIDRYILTEEFLASGAPVAAIGLRIVKRGHCYFVTVQKNKGNFSCQKSPEGNATLPLV